MLGEKKKSHSPQNGRGHRNDCRRKWKKYNPTWAGSRAVTGMRLELLADFFRTLKEMRKKLYLKAKHYSKVGEVGRSTRMTKKPHFFYCKLGKM